MRDKKNMIVLGAGIGGLAAGYFLARTGLYNVTVLEQAPVVGGLCGSFEHNGFTLDYGAHKLYSVIPGILDEIHQIMGDRLLEVPKKNRLFLRNHLVDYPLQLGNIAKVLGMPTFLHIGMGYGLSLVKSLFRSQTADSYEDYIVQRFGRPAYELIFEPLADKVWGDPSELHADMARTRVPASGGLEIILKLLGLKKETSETNAEFFYYPRKGFGDWPEALRELIESHGGQTLVGVDIKDIEVVDDQATSVVGVVDGQTVTWPCDYITSSIPLPILSRLLFGESKSEINQAIQELQFRHLILVYIFVQRPLLLEDQWLFFPERDYIFSRIFEQKQMNPELGPADQTAICCDLTCTEDSWPWQATDEEMVAKCIEGLQVCSFVKSDEVYDSLVIRRTNFYPRYDAQYIEKMQNVNRLLQCMNNVLLTGRIGMYNYNNSDHCADMGRFIADGLVDGQAPRDIWNALEKRVREYKIVD